MSAALKVSAKFADVADVGGSVSLSNPWAPVGQPSQAPRGTILLVDDDLLVARAYSRSLQQEGYTVSVRHDAESALAAVQAQSFDVIVSDVRMPGMSGIDLLRAVREHDLDVPVIIMTGSVDVQTAMAAMEHGAFRYLAKPIELPELLGSVARALRVHETARVRRQTLEELGIEGHQLGDRAALEVRFGRALETLWMAYQPIISWSDRTLFAYEALVRTEEPTLRNPCDLFDAAERLDRVHELGRRIRKHVAGMLATDVLNAPVFVNVHPYDLRDESLFSKDSPLSPFAGRVVLEVTERAALDGVHDLMRRMTRLRTMGYRIALDDLGAGYAGLSSFAQLEPEIVKVDMSIIRGIESSTTKQRVLSAVASLCRDLKIQMVTEGIETAEERDTAVRLGADLCQGFLFARPEKPFPTCTF